MQESFRNFSWILPGALAGAMGPTERRHLIYFERNDIMAIVRMEEQTISAEPWGFEELYEPVPDFEAPTLEQIDGIVNFVEQQVETWERPTVVTCAAGIGRTGTILASYLVNTGWDADEAIAYIRQLRPGSIQTAKQEDAIREYAAFVKDRNDNMPRRYR
ncbi:MAG: dual specificity protein phosphatase family protein [Dehalococcoidia bacterium]|nr:dual specificity protein phosphatase family protein [Dehalococcoidia bacterium]